LIALEIYDILGRRITTLINEQKTAEIYEQTFDASSLASGVYFYKLEAAGINSQNFTSTKKMILTNNP
jgi:predicted Ser/Thr protein kinase